jgi:ABC-type tungstate transport system substrate-binding protein
LFFMPHKESVTLKIVVAEAFALILSSFLPGQGFLTILSIINTMLFFTVIVGLFLDLKPGARALFSETRVQAGAPSPTHS